MNELSRSFEAKVYKPEFPKRPSLITINQGEVLGQGGEGVIYRAHISPGPNRRKRFMAYKEWTRWTDLDYLFSVYNKAKKAGLPVPTTYRFIEGGRGALISDLTDGGKNLVLSLNELDTNNYRMYPKQKEKVIKLIQEKKELLEAFARDKSLFSNINMAMFKDLGKRAAGTGLLIDSDSWFIVVSPSLDQRILLGDFGCIEEPEWSEAKLRQYFARYVNELKLHTKNFKKFILHDPLQVLASGKFDSY
jgi:hypothetical protein